MITFEDAKVLAEIKAADKWKIRPMVFIEEFDCGWKFGYTPHPDRKRRAGAHPIFIDRFDGQASYMLRAADLTRPEATQKRLIWLEAYKKEKYPNGLPPKGKASPNFTSIPWRDFGVAKKKKPKPWWKLW